MVGGGATLNPSDGLPIISDPADRRPDLGRALSFALQRLSASVVPDDLASPSLAVQVPASAATPVGGMRYQAVGCCQPVVTRLDEQEPDIIRWHSGPTRIRARAAFLLPSA